MNPGMNNFDYQDKMSEADFDSASELSRFSNLQIYQKNNIETIRRFFDIKMHYEDEEDLILDIMEDDTIDWNDISSRSRIPRFILDEFSIKIIWINVIYNTELTVRSIIENKIDLLNEFRNNSRVFNNINNDNYGNVLQILKTLNDYNLFIELYKLACKKKYEILLQSMLKLSMISKKDINFSYYLENNNSEIVDAIIKETNIRPTQEDLTNAIKNNHYQTVNVIIDKTDLRPMQYDLTNAICNNHYQMVGVIIDKTDLLTQETLSYVIFNNNYQMAEFIIDKTNLRPKQDDLTNAIKRNYYYTIGVIIDKTDLKPTQHDFINAINNNYAQAVSIIIDKTDFRPTQEDLINAVNKFRYEMVETIFIKTNLRVSKLLAKRIYRDDNYFLNYRGNRYIINLLRNVLCKYNYAGE